jgi:RimJ/RimL family protein N-acetyltransferase
LQFSKKSAVFEHILTGMEPYNLFNTLFEHCFTILNIITMEIKLQRSTLTEWRESYADSLAEHANNSKIAQSLRDSFPNPYTKEDADAWIQFNQTKPKPTINLAIVVEGVCIGAIGLLPKTDIHRCNIEMGYWIGEAYWGQGIVTEAVKYMIKYTFEQFDVVRIYAGVFEGNIGSQYVLKKAGFTLESTIPKGVIKNGISLHEHIYSIIKQDFK